MVENKYNIELATKPNKDEPLLVTPDAYSLVQAVDNLVEAINKLANTIQAK